MAQLSSTWLGKPWGPSSVLGGREGEKGVEGEKEKQKDKETEKEEGKRRGKKGGEGSSTCH